MGLIFLRTTIIFIALLAVMRLMGKRQIGEMQPFEFVITLLIAELACIPMADISIPLLYGVASVVTIFFLHQLLLLFDLQCKPFKAVVGGKPSVVINKNGIDISQLKRNHLDLSDLIESMRSADIFRSTKSLTRCMNRAGSSPPCRARTPRAKKRFPCPSSSSTTENTIRKTSR